MKKVLILIICILILSGCNNSISLDFNDKIDTTIDLSFDKSDFEGKVRPLSSDENFEFAVEDILVEARPIIDNYDEMFEKEYLNVESNTVKGRYKYSYTYENFINNDLFNKCFEYPVVEDLGDSLSIYLSGNSKCGEFKILVKADKRMIINNSDSKENNQYVWDVKEDNNEIKFTISKDIIKEKGDTLKLIFYLIIAVIAGIGVFLFSKHLKKK